MILCLAILLAPNTRPTFPQVHHKQINPTPLNRERRTIDHRWPLQRDWTRDPVHSDPKLGCMPRQYRCPWGLGPLAFTAHVSAHSLDRGMLKGQHAAASFRYYHTCLSMRDLSNSPHSASSWTCFQRPLTWPDLALGPYVRCPYCDNIIVKLSECTSCHQSLIGVRCNEP